MANRLLLLRHASLGPDWTGKLVGSTDVPIHSAARGRVTAVGCLLRECGAEHFEVSPLRRCRETAELAFPGTTFQIDPDLREIDFGHGEGRTFAQIAAEDPELARRWTEFRSDFAFPGGDSLAGFCHRVQSAANRLAASPADTVLAITHGGVIRAMICHLLGIETKNYLLFDINYLGLVEISLHGARGTLTRLDNTLAVEAAHG